MRAEPNLIGPPGGDRLVEPVGGDRQVVMAVCSAHPKGCDWPPCADFRAGHARHIQSLRSAHHIAQDANLERLALILDAAEFHLGASGKMRGVFFQISRSMRRRSFVRRRRAFSAARSAPAGGIAACVFERRGDPAFRRSPASRQERSIFHRSGTPQLPDNLAQRPSAARQQSS